MHSCSHLCHLPTQTMDLLYFKEIKLKAGLPDSRWILSPTQRQRVHMHQQHMHRIHSYNTRRRVSETRMSLQLSEDQDCMCTARGTVKCDCAPKLGFQYSCSWHCYIAQTKIYYKTGSSYHHSKSRASGEYIEQRELHHCKHADHFTGIYEKEAQQSADYPHPWGVSCLQGVRTRKMFG